jgi:hypothetical protein
MSAVFRVGLAVVSLALAAGCGGDDGGSTSGTGAVPAGGATVTGGAGGATGGAGGTAGMMGATGGTGGTFVPGSPTFSAIFSEIIQATGCNAGGLCHGGTLGQGNLLLNEQAPSHAALVGVAAMGVTDPRLMLPNCVDSGLMRVVAGQPDTSLLVKKIEGTMPPCGQPMPPTGPLTPAQVMQIRTWIMNGALND